MVTTPYKNMIVGRKMEGRMRVKIILREECYVLKREKAESDHLTCMGPQTRHIQQRTPRE
jgi:hypothetical protein